MNIYLITNQRHYLKQFSVSDLKPWASNSGNPGSTKNDFCVMCEQASETIEHFLSCPKYGPALETDWRQIDENNAEKQVEIGTFIKNRHKQRQIVLTQQEVGQTSNSGSIAPDM